MESKEKRGNEWLKASAHPNVGPAQYNSDYKKKESFNYGTVPFGSHSKQQFLYKVRQCHDVENLFPGPGQYEPATEKTVTVPKHRKNLSPGATFSKSGMTKDASKVRLMFNSQTAADSGSASGVPSTSAGYEFSK